MKDKINTPVDNSWDLNKIKNEQNQQEEIARAQLKIMENAAITSDPRFVVARAILAARFSNPEESYKSGNVKAAFVVADEFLKAYLNG